MTKMRWWIVFIAFLGTSINYIGRANVGTALGFMGQEFHLNQRSVGSDRASLHCSRCSRYCCACAARVEGGPVLRGGHVYCSTACAESGHDCGAERS